MNPDEGYLKAAAGTRNILKKAGLSAELIDYVANHPDTVEAYMSVKELFQMTGCSAALQQQLDKALEHPERVLRIATPIFRMARDRDPG